jgi:hypothetical protein
MKDIIFLFVGIILIVTGVIVSQSNTRIVINKQEANAETSNTVRNYIGIGIGGLGLFFAIAGFVGMASSSRQKKKSQQILQNGIAAKGTITFVDKNYSLLVNKKPIYSIIEYTYTDNSGIDHTRRINNFNSDIAIRNNFQVGSVIPIKYSVENPAESVMIILN